MRSQTVVLAYTNRYRIEVTFKISQNGRFLPLKILRKKILFSPHTFARLLWVMETTIWPLDHSSNVVYFPFVKFRLFPSTNYRVIWERTTKKREKPSQVEKRGLGPIQGKENWLECSLFWCYLKSESKFHAFSCSI